MINKEEIKKGFNVRALSIRTRTWTLTLAIIIALAFYLILQSYFKENVDPIDLIVIASVGITIHCIYFPDGELYGQRDITYINNKHAYNIRASAINKNRKVKDLRKYCEYEYEQRKQKYILTQCGKIGIDLTDLEQLKLKSPEEIKKIEKFESDGKIIFFTKQSRKRLYALIYKPLPVEENDPNTILSAAEMNYVYAVRDTSIKYKKMAYIKKSLLAVIIGTFLAYIGYTFQDGITLEKITRLFIYLVSIFITAVLSFSKGERCQKVYKNQFYIDLTIFIDGFFEWLIENGETIEIKEEE